MWLCNIQLFCLICSDGFGVWVEAWLGVCVCVLAGHVGWECVLVGWTCVFVGWGCWLGCGWVLLGWACCLGCGRVLVVGRVGWGLVDAQNMINTVSHLIETKSQQRFWTLFLKKFYKILSSYRTKIRFPIKSFLTTFITHKTCFTTICIDSDQKTQKYFFDPVFQKFLQGFVLPIGQKIQFLKKIFSTTFFTQKTCFTHFYID